MNIQHALVLCCSIASQSLLCGQVETHHGRVFGSSAGVGHGTVTAAVGDVNRDGFEDFAAGQPDYASPTLGAEAGRVRVYDGRTQAVLYTFNGTQASGRFGRSCAGAGDVNGDGFPDIMAGWNQDDSFNAGGVHVFSGYDGSLLGTATGYSSIGTVLAGVGDVNGDGRDDMAFGFPNYTSQGGFYAGKVDLVSFQGGSLQLIRVVAGLNPMGLFGSSIAGLGGDVDGDNRPDFVVGEPDYDSTFPTAAAAGRVYVISGGTGAVIHVKNGSAANEHFGSSVGGGGDVNNDGYVDFVAGSTADLAKVFHGRTGVTLFTYQPFFGPPGSLGHAVTLVADVNDDGHDDILLGNPIDDDFGVDAGEVLLISGATGTTLTSFHGADGDQLGASVATADVNGDGRGDLLLGAPFADNNTLRSPAANVGAVVVVSSNVGAEHGHGSTDHFARVAAAGDVDGDGTPDYLAAWPDAVARVAIEKVTLFSGATRQPLRTFQRLQIQDLFGYALDGVGDVDGDGYGDVVIGAPGVVGGTSDEGRVFVYSGGTGALLRTINGTNRESMGTSIAGLGGDVDGDGVPDWAVGMPRHDGLQFVGPIPTVIADSGRVAIMSGATGNVIRYLNGTAAGDRFGHSLSRAGDVNGDGKPDLLIGIPRRDVGGLADAGRLEVRSGLDGSLIHAFDGTQAGEQLGFSVGCAGDTNRDGVPDAIVGAPYRDYSSSIAHIGRARVISGVTGTAILTFDGGEDGDLLGMSVAGLGDVDGDGHDDVAVGAPTDDFHGIGSNRGTVSVFSGATGARIVTHVGERDNDALGASIAGPGDLDRDGRADLAFGMNNQGSQATRPATVTVILSRDFRGIDTYGNGTPGCRGPIQLGANSPPVVGNQSFGLFCTNAPASSVGACFIGPSIVRSDAGIDALGNGLVLHLNLFVGLPLVSFQIASDSTGHARIPLALANSPTMLGQVFEFQALWAFGPCLPHAFGIGTSNGLELTVQ